MQEQERISQTDNHLGPMVRDYSTGLTGEEIEAANRTAVNLQTTEFVFHAWADIKNTDVRGARGNLKYPILKRLQLIPIYPWPYQKIVNRTQGHVSGDMIAGRTRVGTEQKPRTASVADSIAYIVKSFAKMSGIDRIACLKTDSDDGRREAFMLFHAAMETSKLPEVSMRGVDCLLEDLVDINDRGILKPGFLTLAAPLALGFAVKEGVQVPDYLYYDRVEGKIVRSGLFPARIYRFGQGALEKGLTMIEELKRICQSAYDKAAGPTGILTLSRNQINAAKMGQDDTKMQKDPQDLWLERQVPSFSWDTEVDRMREAQRPVLEELRALRSARPVEYSESEEMRLIRENNELLAKQNERLNSRFAELEARMASAAGNEGARAAAETSTVDGGDGDNAGSAARGSDPAAPPSRTAGTSHVASKPADKPRRNA